MNQSTSSEVTTGEKIEAPMRQTSSLRVPDNAGSLPLSECVEIAMQRYFSDLDGEATGHLYDMVMTEVERPLLAAVLEHTNGNQSRAAELLGINRGTLRKKLAQYDSV